MKSYGGAALPRDPTAEDERSPWLDRGHGERELGSEPDLVADLDLLPPGHHPVGAVNVASDEVLEPVVAVETTPALAELSDPRPYRSAEARMVMARVAARSAFAISSSPDSVPSHSRSVAPQLSCRGRPTST